MGGIRKSISHSRLDATTILAESPGADQPEGPGGRFLVLHVTNPSFGDHLFMKAGRQATCFKTNQGEIIMGKLLTILLTGVVLLALVTSPQATTYTVINTNDSGAGSFRWAIQTANLSSSVDTIAFAIPGAGPHTIAPNTALPAITDRVLIDGFTQTGAVPNSNAMHSGINAVLQIELNGASASTGVSNGALDILDNGTVVRGLAITRWNIPGIRLAGSGDHAVEGCYIGTNITGTAGLPNTIGIVVESIANIIGGPDAKDRNLISGNAGEGIYITGDSTVVYGNFIGTDAAGTAALPNRNAGIHVDLADYAEIGGSILPARNLISCNIAGTGGDGDGIWVNGGVGNDVIGNYIGVDVSGTFDYGNAGNGVYIRDSSGGWIGGSSAPYRNVISGNDLNGVRLHGTTNGFHVSGNYIGVDASGLVDIGNTLSGVVTDGTQNNMIGGHRADTKLRARCLRLLDGLCHWQNRWCFSYRYGERHRV
jgi:hypothetical protein